MYDQAKDDQKELDPNARLEKRTLGEIAFNLRYEINRLPEQAPLPFADEFCG